MGYQRVEVTTGNYERKVGVAYNAELILLESEPRSGLGHTAYETLLKSAQRPEGQIVDVRVPALRVVPAL